MDNRRRMMWKKPPEYAIYYTSTDGNIVTPYRSSAFGVAKLLSNEYKDGLGRMVFDRKVDYIYDNAFKSVQNLHCIIFPDTLTYLGQYVFRDCSNLQIVQFNENLASIGEYVFTNCTSLKKIELPDSVTTLGNGVFSDCSQLEYITIGKGLTNIGYSVFNNCSNLKIVNIRDIASWCNVNVSSPSYTPLYYAKNLYLNDELITNLVIPEGVTRIGDYAFYGCSSIQTLNLPNGLTNIGRYAFRDCSGLTGELTIPDSVTSIGEAAFNGCSGINEIQLPNNIHTINTQAFKDCDSLISITLPDSITTLGRGVFSSCAELQTVFLSKGLTNISQETFYGCAKLINVYIQDNVTTIDTYAFYNCKLLKNITLPNSIISINDSAFSGCTSLTNITIPDSVTSIGGTAFNSCTSLTSVTIGNSVTSIGYSAFAGCASLKNITIPNSVTSIGASAFMNCTSLTSVTIGNSVTSIGSRAFYVCKLLTSVTIPDSVTLIGEVAFSGCSSLTSFYGKFSSEDRCCLIVDDIFVAFAPACGKTSCIIPDSVTSIGTEAFSGGKSLTSITIGNSVTSIGELAFSGCNSLASIISKNTASPSIQSRTFMNVKKNGILYYPAGSDYSSWLSTSSCYLGYYDWTSQWLYTPQTYYDLSITAHDVKGNSTTTAISWTCMSDGIDTITGEPITGIQLSGTAISEEFPQNTSETETVERTITFEYQGLTASTTITQGVWINQSYELVLNDNWQLSTAVANPDAALYDGVYESFSNYNKNSTAAIMYIDISGYETFKLYIRSYAESNYDYVMVSQIDQTIDNNSSYSNTTLVKAHTRGTQKSGTTISDYKLVEFTGLDGGEHRITVVYRKDSSGNSGTDKGYLIIPRQ